MSARPLQAPGTPGATGSRGFWPMRDLPMVGWLVDTVLVTLVHPFVPAPRWLMIHLLVLGAAGHAILVWTRYFTDTLLRCPPTPRRPQTIRLGLFNLGVLVVVGGVLSGRWLVTLAGACLVVAAVAWHGATLFAQLRSALGSRFAHSVRYYLAAAALLPIGAGFGVWMSRGLADPLDTQVRAAHVVVNVLGWMGLTVLGTLVTLWPTMLRTRIAPGAEVAARRALPVLLAGILVAAGSALAGLRPGLALGLVCYLAGVAILLVPATREARGKPPASFPTWSVMCGMGWLVGSLAVLTAGVAFAGSWLTVDRRLDAVTPLLAAGFAAQVLLGASSYLVPVVLGGGPAAVRAANRAFDTGRPLRLVVTNAGLAVCVLPVPSLVRVFVSVLVLVALASFVPLLFRAMRASRRVRPAQSTTVTPPPDDPPPPPGRGATLAATGLAVVLVATVLGVVVDPAALGRTADSGAAGAAPTGETTRVTVVAKGMRFHPASVQVPRGNRLVLTVRNASSGDVHDLVLDTGAETGRIAPGGTARLEAGVVGRDLDGWCSVVGHRQMGMTFRVESVGAGQAGDASPSTPHHDMGTARSGTAADDARLDPMAEPTEGFRARDARLPAHLPGRVHRVQFEVTESEHEVAPGVRQTLWTYGGTAPGPVLHGRVGDEFVITLVNHGTIGHSVDFHAGALAPDGPMRTIEPGESLVYRFTATRAGIWMYHCSSMPMSAHIASGLFGAVVIDPPDLPPVDRSFVLVQSELYFGPQGHTLDVDKLNSERPDAVVFNGYANQYDHDPLRVRAGERVRIWVLDAGPNRATSLHVVGGQFDRVWAEGAYRLGSAQRPAAGSGAQALALGAAQGGFAELTFPEPGHYPVVSHVMVDAERGAHGIFEVTD